MNKKRFLSQFFFICLLLLFIKGFNYFFCVLRRNIDRKWIFLCFVWSIIFLNNTIFYLRILWNEIYPTQTEEMCFFYFFWWGFGYAFWLNFTSHLLVTDYPVDISHNFYCSIFLFFFIIFLSFSQIQHFGNDTADFVWF